MNFVPKGRIISLMEDFQDYDECVNKTHCSWLMMTGAFTGKLSDREIKTANEASAKLGYDFYVDKVQVKKLFGKAYVRVGVKNLGVAPIYANLPFISEQKITRLRQSRT